LLFTNVVESLAQFDIHTFVATNNACVRTRNRKDNMTKGIPQAAKCCR